MDALAKDGNVFEFGLAGHHRRKSASKPARSRGARDSQFWEETRVSGPVNVFTDPVVVGPTRRLMELHPSSFRRKAAGRKQRPRIQETSAESRMLHMHSLSSQMSVDAAGVISMPSRLIYLAPVHLGLEAT